MWKIVRTNKYDKDLEKMSARGYDVMRMHSVLQHLQTLGQTPPQARPHKLGGEWVGCWECHVAFDWLLIYSIAEPRIMLKRTGTHDDLFG